MVGLEAPLMLAYYSTTAHADFWTEHWGGHTVAELLFYSEDWAGKCFGNVEMLAGRFGDS